MKTKPINGDIQRAVLGVRGIVRHLHIGENDVLSDWDHVKTYIDGLIVDVSVVEYMPFGALEGALPERSDAPEEPPVFGNSGRGRKEKDKHHSKNNDSRKLQDTLSSRSNLIRGRDNKNEENIPERYNNTRSQVADPFESLKGISSSEKQSHDFKKERPVASGRRRHQSDLPVKGNLSHVQTQRAGLKSDRTNSRPVLNLINGLADALLNDAEARVSPKKTSTENRALVDVKNQALLPLPANLNGNPNGKGFQQVSPSDQPNRQLVASNFSSTTNKPSTTMFENRGSTGSTRIDLGANEGSFRPAPEIDPDKVTALVNEVLVAQARRHGVDLS